MKKTIKFFVAIVIGIMISFYTNSVQANYQSNNQNIKDIGGTTAIIGIRQMEASGNVMGLEEEIDSKTLNFTTPSNNIDVHMLRNTEWGAMALLSASQDYGKKGEGSARYVYNDGTNDVNKHTSTGNAYGVYITARANQTTGGKVDSGFMSGVDRKYLDNYSSSNTFFTRPGDAMMYWHGSNSSASWLNYQGHGNIGYVRGSDSGIYAFSRTYDGSPNRTRAVIVNGEGF